SVPGTYTVTAAATTSSRELNSGNNTATTTLAVTAPSSSTTSAVVPSTAVPAPTTASSTSAATTTSSSPTVPTLKYKAYMDGLLTSYDSTATASASTLDEGEYERFAWIIDGVTAMFEGTNDASYIIKALSWVELMKATAAVVDVQGNLNWAGSWASPYS